MFVLEIVHLLMGKAHLGAHGHDLFEQVTRFTAISLTVGKVVRGLIELAVILTPLHQIGLLHIFKCLNVRTWLNHVLPYTGDISGVLLGFAYLLGVHWIFIPLRGPSTLLNNYLIFDLLPRLCDAHFSVSLAHVELLAVLVISGREAATCPDVFAADNRPKLISIDLTCLAYATRKSRLFVKTMINRSVWRVAKIDRLQSLPVNITNVLLFFDLCKLTLAVLKPLVYVTYKLVVKSDPKRLILGRFISFGLLCEAQRLPIIFIYVGAVQGIANILDVAKNGGRTLGVHDILLRQFLDARLPPL